MGDLRYVGFLSIDVAICTFQRLSVLETLDSVSRQSLPPDVVLRAIVAENSEEPEMRETIETHAAALSLDLTYVHAPARNISIARNACLDTSQSNLLLFIDDDEIAEPDWVSHLVSAWRATQAGAIFGPAIAVYPPTAPSWMRENNFHSNIPSSKKGTVETGYSSNVLLDRRDHRVRDARFDLAFGRTGGEDVDFFFRLHRAGVPMAIAQDAVVHEHVAPARMSFKWVLSKRHMHGAIYGSCVAPENAARRMMILLKSVAKAGYCTLRSVISVMDRAKCCFWIMRTSFHLGVVSGCISPPRREFYGGAQ